jgi:endonuclease/exonuclease/phosphatase family metal-dependent hydrolase
MPPYGPVGTANGFKLDAPLKNRIDYIFVSPSIQVLKYASLTDSKDQRFPSDHQPVVAKIKF